MRIDLLSRASRSRDVTSARASVRSPEFAAIEAPVVVSPARDRRCRPSRYHLRPWSIRAKACTSNLQSLFARRTRRARQSSRPRSRLLASPWRASRKGPIQTFYPHRVPPVASFRARVRARASRATSSVPRAPSSTFIAVHTRARAFDRASVDVRTSARGPSHHIRVVRSRRRRRTGGVRARADRGHAHGRERGGLLRPSQERRSRRHRAKFVRRRVRTTRATTRRTIARVGASRVCVFIHR